ncbi:Microtubule-associated protein RP/EB family member 1A [Linum perenne]
MASNIGMMDGAYFVGRNEILTWINNCLQLNLSRIEEAASGAVQCQMMDMTHPGVVPMHKVNFDAKSEYDYIQNYKVLQDVFNKLKIEKVLCNQLQISRMLLMHGQHIEVNKLVKARPLDNLEFLQWLKRYCDSVNGGIMNENYNPIERRSKVGKDRCRGSLKAAKSLQANNTHQSASVDSGPKHVKGGAAAGGSSMDIQALSTEVTDLKLSVDLLEKERDFYFAKLRDIEILCQIPELETIPVAIAIKKILYAADAKESALEEAQEYLAEALNNGEEADEEA